MALGRRRCPATGRIVEIGSFRGRSMIALARSAPAGAEVVAIDPHAGNDRGPQEIEGFADEAAGDNKVFLANLERAGVRDRVHLRPQVQPRRPRRRRRAHRPAVHRRRPPLRAGPRRHPPAGAPGSARGGTMLVHDSFSSVGVTLALAAKLAFSGRWRYAGRSRSLAEYRREPVPGAARVANVGRQLAQLPWFARNLAIKVLIVAKLPQPPAPARPRRRDLAVLSRPGRRRPPCGRLPTRCRRAPDASVSADRLRPGLGLGRRRSSTHAEPLGSAARAGRTPVAEAPPGHERHRLADDVPRHLRHAPDPVVERDRHLDDAWRRGGGPGTRARAGSRSRWPWWRSPPPSAGCRPGRPGTRPWRRGRRGRARSRRRSCPTRDSTLAHERPVGGGAARHVARADGDVGAAARPRPAAPAARSGGCDRSASIWTTTS